MARRDDVGVIFDLDGVLVDSEELYYRSYSEVLARYGVSVTAETYSRIWIQGGKGPEWAVREFGLPMTPEELRLAKQPIYVKLLETELRPIAGARECVRRLAAAFPVVLATNSYAENVEQAMRVLGPDVRACFRDLVTKERFSRPKPAPDAFVAGAAALGLAPGRCVVIEDAEKGLVASRAAGTRCIVVPCALTRGGDFAAADRVLASLDDVTAEVVGGVADAPLRR